MSRVVAPALFAAGDAAVSGAAASGIAAGCVAVFAARARVAAGRAAGFAALAGRFAALAGASRGSPGACGARGPGGAGSRARGAGAFRRTGGAALGRRGIGLRVVWHRFRHSGCVPWQCLYLRPLPQGHGSLRPTLGHRPHRGLSPARGRFPASRFAQRGPGRRDRAGRGRGAALAAAKPLAAACIASARGGARRWWRRRRLAPQLHAEEELERLFLKLVHQRLEHLEGFALVLEQRVLLPVGAQPDAAAQDVDLVQVVLPVVVDDAQVDLTLDLARRRLAPLLLARLIRLARDPQRLRDQRVVGRRGVGLRTPLGRRRAETG